MTVAVAAELVRPLVAQPLKEVGDLQSERLGQDPFGAFSNGAVKEIVGGGNKCSGGQNLIPCRHGVASRIDPVLRAEVGVEHLEGYAVFVPSLSGSSEAVSTSPEGSSGPSVEPRHKCVSTGHSYEGPWYIPWLDCARVHGCLWAHASLDRQCHTRSSSAGPDGSEIFRTHARRETLAATE
jgi:hypothetical protein